MKNLRLGDLWFPVTTLGYGKRLGLWFQGCFRNCPGCISPEFKSYEDGRTVTLDGIDRMIPEGVKIDGLTISGGEPFEQLEGLEQLVSWFLSKFGDDILIFTGYTLAELKEKQTPAIDYILNNISVLVDGTYDEAQNNGIGLRGSENQCIHVFKNSERYQNPEHWTREVQCVFKNNRMWMLGIPPKEVN